MFFIWKHKKVEGDKCDRGNACFFLEVWRYCEDQPIMNIALHSNLNKQSDSVHIYVKCTRDSKVSVIDWRYNVQLKNKCTLAQSTGKKWDENGNSNAVAEGGKPYSESLSLCFFSYFMRESCCHAYNYRPKYSVVNCGPPYVTWYLEWILHLLK